MKTFPQPLSAREEREYLERYKEGDQEAREVLIHRNMRLVAHIVKKYQAELEKIDAEIKEQEKIVDGYREEEKREKLAKLSNIIGKKGVDIDTFLNAVMNNDLYSVQEMLEKAGKETKEETSSTAPKVTSDEPTNSSSTSGMSNNTANGQ